MSYALFDDDAEYYATQRLLEKAAKRKQRLARKQRKRLHAQKQSGILATLTRLFSSLFTSTRQKQKTLVDPTLISQPYNPRLLSEKPMPYLPPTYRASDISDVRPEESILYRECGFVRVKVGKGGGARGGWTSVHRAEIEWDE